MSQQYTTIHSLTRPTYCNQSTHGCHHGDSAVLQLNRSTSLERSHIAIRSKAYGVPKANWCLHTELILEGKPVWSGLDCKVSEWVSSQTILPCDMCIVFAKVVFANLISMQCWCTLCSFYSTEISWTTKLASFQVHWTSYNEECEMWETDQVIALLEEHTHNGDHGQATIGKLWRKFALLDNWVLRSDELPSEVTNSPWSSRRLALRHFAEGHPGQNLTPSSDRDLRDSCQAVWNVCKFQAGGRGKVAWEFPSNLWGHIAHGGEHGNSTVLDFSLTTSLVGVNITVSCESNWIPKSEWRLCSHLILKCSQWRSSVVGPVTPGASSQAILRRDVYIYFLSGHARKPTKRCCFVLLLWNPTVEIRWKRTVENWSLQKLASVLFWIHAIIHLPF